MDAFIAEIIGTALLIYLGNGVVANVVLKDTKGHDSGWIVITLGWGLAVYVGVLVAGPYSGAHMNPAVSVGLACAGKFSWNLVPSYVLGQCLGAALGSTLVWLTYYNHYKVSEDQDGKLATFSTGPAIRNLPMNFVTEVLGTFVLVFVVLYIAGPSISGSGMGDVVIGLGSLGALPVALLVVAIGLSLGGPTGYAINPARDLAPRIMHTILPIGDKRDADWSYSWVPIVGPIVGGVLAGGLYLMLSS